MTGITAERSQHLLVVDDDREIRDLVSRFMTRHGYRVTAGQDGRELMQALRDWSVDLIVLDLMPPAMGEEMGRIAGLEKGADDYLPKPFNSRELLARIKAVVHLGCLASGHLR